MSCCLLCCPLGTIVFNVSDSFATNWLQLLPQNCRILFIRDGWQYVLHIIAQQFISSCLNTNNHFLANTGNRFLASDFQVLILILQITPTTCCCDLTLCKCKSVKTCLWTLTKHFCPTGGVFFSCILIWIISCRFRLNPPVHLCCSLSLRHWSMTLEPDWCQDWILQ